MSTSRPIAGRRAELHALRAQGYSLDQLARHFDVTATAIKYHLRQPKVEEHRLAPHRDEVMIAREADESWNAIGQRLGFTGEAVARAHARWTVEGWTAPEPDPQPIGPMKAPRGHVMRVHPPRTRGRRLDTMPKYRPPAALDRGELEAMVARGRGNEDIAARLGLSVAVIAEAIAAWELR